MSDSKSINEMVVSPSVYVFLDLMQTQPKRFEASYGSNAMLFIKDFVTGVRGSVYYGKEFFPGADPVELGYGCMDFHFVNALEAKVLYEAISKFMQDNPFELPDESPEKFKNAYQV